MDLKVLQVHYEKISVFDMLTDIAKIAGVDSIQKALDEIAAQQGVQRIAFGKGMLARLGNLFIRLGWWLASIGNR